MTPASWPIDTGGAPAGYTLTVDITEALAIDATALHVLVDGVEIDRIITGSSLDFRVPPAGTLLLVEDASTRPYDDPANVYLFAESFEAFAPGDATATRFVVIPALDWTIADDAGNHVLHAGGTSRHPAAIQDVTLADGDIRGRMRVGAGGSQQHNGLAARGNNMEAATMDGFVGQLLGDVNRTRIAEYTDGASPPIELAGDIRAVTRGTWYSLRMRFVGDVVELFIDGTLALSATKSGWDGDLVGLYAHDPDVDFDDVTVRMAMTPEPIAQLGARSPCP
jgi:hypothetical protein